MPPALTRPAWLSILLRVAEPPIAALAAGQLRARLPVQSRPGREADRAQVTHLEAFARTLSGLAPWLALEPAPPDEAAARDRLRTLAAAALTEGLNPASPDAFNFTHGGQPLVDAAFLAQAPLRAPGPLFYALDARTRARLLAGLRSTRAITPCFNNWLLFAASIEAAPLFLDSDGDRLRIDYAIRQHEQWYEGDGAYGDGPDFSLGLLQQLRHPAHAPRRAGNGRRARRPLARTPSRRAPTRHAPRRRARAPRRARRLLPGCTSVSPATSPTSARPILAPATSTCAPPPFSPSDSPPPIRFGRTPETLWTSARIWRGENPPADSALYA